MWQDIERRRSVVVSDANHGDVEADGAGGGL